MSEISERYGRLADAFAAKVRSVPTDAWSNQSPCEEWTARDLVGHVVGTQGMFLGLVGREMGEVPSVDDDPVAAWDAVRAVVQRDLEDPATATTEFDGFAGRSTFESAVDRFLNTDLVIHAWDLARAAGLDERIEPEDVERVTKNTASFGDAMRGPKVFGPAVDPPSGADDQQRLLAFLGRQP